MMLITQSDYNPLGMLADSILQGVFNLQGCDAMPIEEKVWEEMVKNILRAEMMRRGVSYAGLAERLQEHGIEDNELNLRNKVSRGRFTAVFFMQCMQALGVELLQIPQAIEEAARKGGAQALAKSKAQKTN
ncbi:MAG: hypothetical protein KKE77_08375 [Alphaproteobacteria bacterium]|nr:hypothetical protein [Alphaproteobacteria bacterium]